MTFIAYLSPVSDAEQVAIAYCTKSNRGARVIPDGTLKGVHFVRTPEYVQVTGVGDFTKINIPQGDAGGEIDNKGADARGNPSESQTFWWPSKLTKDIHASTSWWPRLR